MLRRQGRIAWSTSCILFPTTTVRIERGAVIHGEGLVALQSGSRLEVGARSTIMRGAEISIGEGSVVQIGAGTYVGSHVNLRCDGTVRIGNDVLIGQFVSIVSSNYRLHDTQAPAAHLTLEAGAVTVEDGVWIGVGAIILPQVVIGRGAVVGAGAVVTHDVIPMTIVAGNPAREIGSRSTSTPRR